MVRFSSTEDLGYCRIVGELKRAITKTTESSEVYQRSKLSLPQEGMLTISLHTIAMIDPL